MDESQPPNEVGADFYGMTLTKPDTYDIGNWRRWEDATLLREYQGLMKATFDQMFGHNARRAINLLARILIHERKITAIPNIFGDLPIKDNWGDWRRDG